MSYNPLISLWINTKVLQFPPRRQNQGEGGSLGTLETPEEEGITIPLLETPNDP
jgi:hypothetical protein